MDVFLALLGAMGVVMAMAANATNIARFVGERRRANRGDGGGPRAPGAGSPSATPVAATVTLTAPPAPGRAPPTPGPAIAPRSRGDPGPPIRTPDQRVRVFVSSTLHELAAEREAVRRAVEALRLTPVLFELGARPHPPRDLYRAYLAQSDVFVGIYDRRYGWVAPGEEVSGLEDEYHLSAGMPRLVYVRRSDEAREPRLEALLARLRDDGDTSYKSFATADELERLVGDDLALLLSERFAQPPHATLAEPPPATAPLPVPPTSFVGRTALLDELTDLIQRPDVRLLTLTGPGGAGKSRVAIELAERVRRAFAGDVMYVSLAAVRDPALVASSLALELGVRAAAEADSVRSLRSALSGRTGLLLVDNFEHLVDAATVVAEVLQAAPGLTVLVTSRTRLRLSQEVAFPIPPLMLPASGPDLDPAETRRSEAVRLFVERARAVDPRFEPDADELAAIVEICRRADALPLAIELAAARVRSLPPRALAARMSRRLPLLTGGPRDAPARQRTLRDAIDWSVELLDAREQSVFARLSLFDGGGSLELVERVLAGQDGAAPSAADVLEAVTQLIDQSLVQRDEADDDRVAMLETVREYAAERLAADPARGPLRERHARAYLALAEEGSKALKGSDQARWGRWLVRDLGNLRAAMDAFLEAEAGTEALRLATALRPLFLARGHYEEGRRMLERALTLGHDASERVRAAALLALGALRWREGDLAGALPPLEESLAAYRRAGDEAGTADTLRLLGVHAHNAGAYDLARRRLEEALAAMRARGDEEGIANTLLSLGNVAFDRAEPTAKALYEESRAIFERLDDALGLAYALDNLGVLAWCRGELAASSSHNEAAARLYERLEHPFGLASAAHRRGLIALAREDLVGAEAHLTHSLRLRAEINEGRGCAFVRYDLGRVALLGGRAQDARTHLRLGLAHAVRHGGPLVEVLFLEGTAWLLATERQDAPAAELLAAADAWRRSQGVPVCRVNRERHEELVASLRTRLGERAWVDASARGGAWDVTHAVARAADALDEPPR